MRRSLQWFVAALCFTSGALVAITTADTRRGAVAGGEAVSAPARVTHAALPPDDGKLRIICFGAHPDDCELQAGGMAALSSEEGSTTGDFADDAKHYVEHHSDTFGGEAHWNVRNRNNQVVASGVYFYHVEAGDARRVGRFTVVNFAQ